MMKEMWTGQPGFQPTKSAPSSPAKPLGVSRTRSETFHVTHKVPVGDTPYVRAKNVQLVEKDPERAIPLFWAAINAGDRVDSALKDMAIVMKQQNRAEEAIEAIKSLRCRCSDQAQESLDNILLDLYKRCGRLDDQIALLRRKLFLIQQGMAFNGKRTKTARSQGKKFQVSVEQEATRLLGNLGWALMQQNNYIEAEEAYRRALLLSPDNNKMCNLGICLMKQGRIVEAKETLRRVKPAVADGPRGVDSHLKAYERAQQMLKDLESEMMNKGGDRVEQRKLFDAFLGSSAIWQPQPCKENTSSKLQDHGFADENANSNIMRNNLQQKNVINSFNIDERPFYSSKLGKDHASVAVNGGAIWQPQPCKENTGSKLQDHGFADENANSNIMRNNLQQKNVINSFNIDEQPFYSSKLGKDHVSVAVNGGSFPESLKRKMPAGKQSTSPEKRWANLLPDSEDFEDAIIAAVLGHDSEKRIGGEMAEKKKVDKRLRVFQDITPSLSPRA